MTINHSLFQRRLRLLLAKEFAARGYFLEAEGFFHQVPIGGLGVEELALLSKMALISGNQKLAKLRFQQLLKLQPTNQEAKAGLLAAENLKASVWQRLKEIGRFGKLKAPIITGAQRVAGSPDKTS